MNKLSRTLAALVLAASPVAVTGCAYSMVPHTPLERLDHDYQSGKDARSAMQRQGIPVTEQSCADMYSATNVEDNDNSRDKTWLQARLNSYVNGCLDRPRTGVAITSAAPSVASTSGAGSR